MELHRVENILMIQGMSNGGRNLAVVLLDANRVLYMKVEKYTMNTLKKA